jgi:hypothetical protein
MAESTLALTFQDLVIRVAEYLGVAYYGPNGDEAAQMPPSATHDREMCERIVNDGIRMFVQASPKWRWMRPVYSLALDPTGAGPQNIDSDAARYKMPDDFNGDFEGRWRYATTGAGVADIRCVDESEIRSLRAASNHAGDPYLVAVRPLDTDGANKRKWEAIFYPTPSAARAVTVPYRRYVQKLSNPTDLHPAGAEHDAVIVAACIAEAELQRDDQAGARMAHYAQLLKNAVSLDQNSAPRRLGQNLDGSNDWMSPSRRYLGAARLPSEVTYLTP